LCEGTGIDRKHVVHVELETLPLKSTPENQDVGNLENGWLHAHRRHGTYIENRSLGSQSTIKETGEASACQIEKEIQEERGTSEVTRDDMAEMLN